MTHECKGCRKRKVLVKHIAGRGYCEGCKDKAPTAKQMLEYLYPREKGHFVEFDKKKSRGLGSGKPVDKE